MSTSIRLAYFKKMGFYFPDRDQKIDEYPCNFTDFSRLAKFSATFSENSKFFRLIDTLGSTLTKVIELAFANVRLAITKHLCGIHHRSHCVTQDVELIHAIYTRKFLGKGQFWEKWNIDNGATYCLENTIQSNLVITKLHGEGAFIRYTRHSL